MKRRLCITNTGIGRPQEPLLVSHTQSYDYIEVEGEFDYDVEDVEDLEQFVQVRYLRTDGATSPKYTYRDPGLSLRVGDIVDVPVGVSQIERALVCKLGKGTWAGTFKNVHAVVLRADR